MTRWHLMAGIVVILALASCSRFDSEETIVTVSAAASLTDAMAITERVFEAENPDFDLQVNIAGSSTLVFQVQEGASVDIVVLADRVAMDQLGDRVRDVALVAHNELTLLHRTDGPEIASIDDLTDGELIVVACDANVPCGRLTENYLDASGLDIEFDSREANVRVARERVLSGEADAAFVYRTDIVDRAAVDVIDLDGPGATSDVVIGSLNDSEPTRTFREFFATQGSLYLEMVGFEIP